MKWACITVDAALQFPAPWAAFGSVSHDELTQLVESIHHYHIVRCKVSNVAGAPLQQAIEHSLRVQYPELMIERFSAADDVADVKNHYRQAAKLGADRFASAIGAHYCFPDDDLIVATCGTATTIDAITAEGEFLGGMILPGLQLMASALASNTAQLPQIALHADTLDVFGKQTDHAIASGCLHAQIGAMQCAVQHLESTRNKRVKLIVSGGAAPYLLPQLARVPHLQWQSIENLVLTGLWIAAKSS